MSICPYRLFTIRTQFEEFPCFMEGVKPVEQLDDKRLHWDVEIAGKPKEWRITQQIPDQRIAWKAKPARTRRCGVFPSGRP